MILRIKLNTIYELYKIYHTSKARFMSVADIWLSQLWRNRNGSNKFNCNGGFQVSKQPALIWITNIKKK